MIDSSRYRVLRTTMGSAALVFGVALSILGYAASTVVESSNLPGPYEPVPVGVIWRGMSELFMQPTSWPLIARRVSSTEVVIYLIGLAAWLRLGLHVAKVRIAYRLLFVAIAIAAGAMFIAILIDVGPGVVFFCGPTATMTELLDRDVSWAGMCLLSMWILSSRLWSSSSEGGAIK